MEALVETRGRKRTEAVAPRLLKSLRRFFSTIKYPKDPRGRPQNIGITDCLMSAVAMFGLKYPSLLQFDRSSHDEETIKHNLKTLYGVENTPCDTYMRNCLDEVDPSFLRPAFKKLFGKLQRDKILESFTYLDEGYIISIDGTGYFNSHEIHCDSCCQKHHRNGKITYYHQMLAASLISPEKREVIPLCPEPIIKQDGCKKNDCELNAVKRLLCHIREDHPFLKLVAVEDTLYGVEPHIKQLNKLNIHYIIGVKPKRHKNLFDYLSGQELNQFEFNKDGKTHRFCFFNDAPFKDLKVNFLEYWEIEDGKTLKHFTWITDIPITQLNVFRLMRTARGRWKIENETFNTLKNQGYQFEHNFGHGYKHLSCILAYVMMLGFLIDQAQALCCRLFQGAWTKIASGVIFWQKLRALFFEFWISSWEDIYFSIRNGYARPALSPNTS